MTKQITVVTLAELDELVGLLNVLFSQDIEFEPNPEKQRAGFSLSKMIPLRLVF
jgi:hypothetical protein